MRSSTRMNSISAPSDERLAGAQALEEVPNLHERGLHALHVDPALRALRCRQWGQKQPGAWPCIILSSGLLRSLHHMMPSMS